MTLSLLLPMMVTALLVSGMGVALLGSVKLPLATRLQIDEARVGGLVSLFGFAMMPIIFLAGFLTDGLGPQAVFIGGSVLFAVSLGLLALARGYALALAAVVVLSGGWSLLINVGNVLTPVAFPGTKAYATNLANVFFGLGAFLTPLAAAFLLRRSSLPATLALLGAVGLVPGVLAWGVDFNVSAPPSEEAAGTITNLADPTLLWCGLALFFYAPLEASMAAWATTLLGDRGVKQERAAGLLSGFWLAFMAARLITAFTLPSKSEALLILALGVICVLVLLGVVLSRGAGTGMGLVVAAGFVFGPIFPTIMAILLGYFHPSVHGRAVGLLFAIGGVGWTIVPILIGAYARRTSVQRGFAVAVGAAVGLCVIASILRWR